MFSPHFINSHGRYRPIRSARPPQRIPLTRHAITPRTVTAKAIQYLTSYRPCRVLSTIRPFSKSVWRQRSIIIMYAQTSSYKYISHGVMRASYNLFFLPYDYDIPWAPSINRQIAKISCAADIWWRLRIYYNFFYWIIYRFEIILFHDSIKNGS